MKWIGGAGAACALLAAMATRAGPLGPVLDPHFGDGGFSSTDHGGGVDHSDFGRAVARQGDRLLIAAAASRSGDAGSTFHQPALLRLSRDGRPDEMFGDDGWLATPTSGANGELVDVATTADGKILGFGWYNTGAQSPAHAFFTRLSAEGVPDTGFGANALRPLSFGDGDLPTRMALQADGKAIGLVNFGLGGTRACIGVVRIATDGSTDTDFRNGGSECLTSDNATTPIAFGMDVALQADGKIVIAGYANHRSASNGDMFAARLLADGRPDPAFGEGGFTWVGYDRGGSLFEGAHAVAVDSAGRIVLAGGVEEAASTAMAVVRLTPAGQLDPTFGVLGRASVAFGRAGETATGAWASSVTVLPGDGVLVAGSAAIRSADTGSVVYGAVAALDAEGQPQTRFGNAGTWTIRAPDFAIDGREGAAFADAVRDGEEIHFVGYVDSVGDVPSGIDRDVAAVKLSLPLFIDDFEML